MDTFKKIYIALISMTLLSFLYYGLAITGVIKINLLDETSMYIFLTATYILIMSVIFSRAANVIANRKNRVVGYISTIVGLVNLLILAIYMISKNDVINDIASVMTKINIYTLLMVLVFEIPQSNSAHGKFQKFVAGLITITCIFPYITGLKEITASTTSISSLYNNSSSSYDGFDYNSYEEYEEDKKKTETLNKIENVLVLMSLAGFIVNPMLRVYYIDRDYTALQEMDDIFETVTKYSANTDPNPNKVLSDKYKPNNTQQPQPQYQQPVEQQMYQQPQQTMPAYAAPVIEDMPREKVVNQKFQQEVHPEAIIPTIDGLEEQTTNPLEAAIQPEIQPEPQPTETVISNAPNPLEEAIKPVEETTQPDQQPVETVINNAPNPLEAAIQPATNTTEQNQ